MGLYFSAAMVRSLMSGLELNVRSSSACSKSRNIAATLGSFDDAIPPSPRTLGYPTSVWIPSGVERESRQVNQPIHKSALATILLNLNVRVVVMWQIVTRTSLYYYAAQCCFGSLFCEIVSWWNGRYKFVILDVRERPLRLKKDLKFNSE